MRGFTNNGRFLLPALGRKVRLLKGSKRVKTGETMSQEAMNTDATPCTDASVEAIVARLKANRANTLALCACLAVCETRMPYREAEALIAERPELTLSMQNAHALLRIMIDCGGIEAEEVPEPACDPGEEPQDCPVDYIVCTTEAGHAALACFEPTKRFAQVLCDEPAEYAVVYALVLNQCRNGATKAAIEEALAGNPALSSGSKQVYPSYFISKLETVGGLLWDGSWKTTEAGQQMLAMVG